MGIDTTSKKVQINKLVSSQVPSFVVEDNPLFVDFLKQYYISQEYQGGNIDIVTNLNDYQKVENFTENSSLVGFTTCTSDVNSYDATINVSSTEGWPDEYGLLKIGGEIITYTSKTETSFKGCVRGFCGVDSIKDSVNPENLVFSQSESVKHLNNTRVINLSNLFLQEFWKKTKNQFLPGFEDRKLHSKVDKANFLRQAKDFYSSKGTDEAIKILFGVLFDARAEVIKPIEYLFAPSDADYIKTDDLIVEVITGNPENVVGQTLFQTDNTATSGSIFNVQYLPRNNRHYYIISLSKGSTVGTFTATGSSSLVDPVSIGSTVLSVDSTLGFPDKGTVYVGAGLTVGIATYTNRSSTQFFGVTGISSSYTDSDFVRSTATVYAYENGDINKPVYFRLTNVANGADVDDIGFLFAKDIIEPRQLGRVSDSSNHNLNTWIHNIKTKSDVARDIQTATSKVDVGTSIITTNTPHLLRTDDTVTLLDISDAAAGAPSNVDGTVLQVYNDNEFRISITSGALNTSKVYKVRRELNYAKSTNNLLGVSKFTADVQNTYTTRDNKTVYITTGSLPSYEIFANDRSKEFTSAEPGPADQPATSNVNHTDDLITINNHNFLSGQLVRYSPVNLNSESVVGLDTGSVYAVSKKNDNQLYLSRSVADAVAKKYISIIGIGTTTSHRLTPSDLADKNVTYQNFLRKFPIKPEVKEFERSIENEPVGMFRNGVEIFSNKSGDSIHYGPIEHIDVESGGSGYDIISPPNINISDNVGSGATAYAVIEGGLEGIEVLSGGYDIKRVPNVAIVGGNGQGATASARLKAIRNSRLFDAKDNITINTRAVITVTLSSGVINAASISNAGTGYIESPTITIPDSLDGNGNVVGTGGELSTTVDPTGRVTSITVIDGGSGYSSAPTVTISSPEAGTTATGTAVLTGNTVSAINITNPGSGYTENPEVSIDITTGGGGTAVVATSQITKGIVTAVSVVAGGSGYTSPPTIGVEQPPGEITFSSDHLFFDGESIVYEKSALNPQIPGLVHKSVYYVDKINERRIRLMNKFEDAINNTKAVILTAQSIGSHSITATDFRNVVDQIVVENEGSGYSNRKVEVKSIRHPSINYYTRQDVRSGISTANNYMFHKMHGFNSGDLVEYKIAGIGSTAISGLSTNSSYHVTKLDEDKFRLSYAGVKGGRTNIISNSEDIEGSVTAGAGGELGTLTADVSVTTPDGGSKAYTFTGEGSSGTNVLRIRPGIQETGSVGLKTDTHYVFSAFVKKSDHRYVRIGNAGEANWVDPHGGITLDFDTGNTHVPTNVTHASGVISYPNGWYRLWWEDKTKSVGNGAEGTINQNTGWTIALASTANGTINSTNIATTDGTYVWGLQAEEVTNYPTEYIPTSGLPRTVDTIGSVRDYHKGKFVDIGSNIGIGCTHIFKYPDIEVKLESTSGREVIEASSLPIIRPLMRGSIRDVFLTETGVGYGSTDTINGHRRPLVTISNGSKGLVDVDVSNGELSDAFVKISGEGYASPPELIVEGEGKYGKLISNVENGELTSVIIADKGKDYTKVPDTTVRIKPQGSGAVFRGDLRGWRLTTVDRYKNSISQNDDGIILPSQHSEYGSKFVSAYLPRKLRLILDDNINTDLSEKTSLSHSPIVGWSYDGAPIYGPYGYTSNTGGTVRRLLPGYTANLKSNRPPTSIFPLGFFVEDYDYTASGDLDENNGRFGKTPEYPDGVYAYFCTISSEDGDGPFTASKKPVFPYVLNGYHFKKEELNGRPLSLQTLSILNSGDLIRNTLPYKLGFLNADYDYLVSNNIEDTELSIQTIAKSGIGSVLVKEPGENYKIGDTVVFNNDYSGGRNAMARVRTLVGKGITEVSYTKTTINNITFDYRNANGNGIGIAATAHGLQNNDLVIVSGIGTGELKFLEGPKTIAVSSVTSKLGSELRRIGLTGDTEFIELVDVVGGRTKDDDIMVDDWLIIGENEEKVRVLEIDETLGQYKILRQTGIGQTWFDAGTRVSIDQSKFTFSAGIGTDLIIRRNATLTFDPQGTIGIGTVLVNLTTDNGLTAPTVRMKARNNEILEDHQLPPNIGQPGSNADNTISIPNHGLLTGQRLRYSKSPVGAALSVSPNVGLGNSFRLEDGSYVYAVKKSNDLLGITTTRVGVGTTSASLYICTIKDANKVAHSFRTTNEEHVGSVDKIDVGVYTVSEHTLKTDDDVTIDISSNAIINKTIEYDADSRSTIVDPYYIASSNISTSDSSFTLNNHVFEDGDKILYSHTTNPSNKVSTLTNGGEYYVKKISANKFRLFDNRKDAISVPSAHIKIIHAGSGVHRIVRINPPISVMRGETVGFAVSDPSNTGFILEFFKDDKFENEFDGIGISTEIVRTGDPGTAGAIVNLKLTNDVPLPLWYKLTPTSLNTINDSKRDSYPDDNVISRSKISITPSTYAGNFGIKTTGITSFTYQVPVIPERTSYTQSGISTYRYVTDSENALGGINEIQVRFPGVDYQKNPGISSIRTTTGKDGFIRMYDDTLGRPGYKEVVKIGYDYPTDKSLSPRADTPVTVTVENNLVIGSIGIVTAGRNYSTSPDLFFPIRPTAKTKVHLEGTSIGSVEILEDSLTGFNEVPNPPRIIPINNTNGVGVVTARCFDNSGNPNTSPLIEIKRPIGGWRPADHDDGTNFPFAVGDDVYIENVNIDEGDDPRVYAQGQVIGYNSDMYDYNTFKITEIDIGNSWFKYSLVGIGTWGGTFDPINSAGRVIKKGDLPTFNVTFEHRDFINGEPVTFGDGSATGEMLKNWGWDAATNSFRLRNLTRTPYVGDVVVGRLSKASGKVVKSIFKERYFTLDHKADRVKGWQKDTGKLNNDFQRIPDNDYYQNFSYSIQSEVQEQNFKDALENIAHPTGYKNFSDLIIKSNATAGFARSTTLTARSPQSATDLKVNIDNIASMYVKNDYDFATEETFNTGGSDGGGTDLSKFISFQNRKITNLLSVSSAKVEIIDDISGKFDGKTGSFLGEHTFLRSDSSINGGAGITIVSGGSGSLTPAVQKYHNVSNAAYTASNGNMVLTLESGHGLLVGESVHIEKESLPFTCAMDGNSYIKNYPRSTDPQYNKFVDITAVSGNNITVNVGTSPIVNHNVTNATYNPNTGDMELTIGSHTLDIGESIKITTGSLIFQCTQDNNGSDHAYPRNTIDNHSVIDADYDPATGLIDIKTSATHGLNEGDLVKLDDNSINFKCDYGNYPHTYVGGTVTNGVAVTGGSSFNVTDAYYTGNNGHLVLTIGTHSLTTSNTVTLTSGAFKFTCDSDDNTAILSYPRATDPAHNTAINIIAVDQAGGRITVNVGTKADDVKSYPRSTDPISGKWKKVLSVPSSDRFVIQVLNTIPSTNTDIHYYVRAAGTHIYNGGTVSNAFTVSGSGAKSVTDATYNPATGDLVLTSAGHGLTTSNTIIIGANKLSFTCDADNHATSHTYPRTTDPVHNTAIAITSKTTDTITVNVGKPKSVDGIKQKRDRAYDSAIPIKAITSTKITLNVGKSSNTTTHRWKPSHTASNAIQSGGNYTHTWIGGTKTDSVTSGGTSYDPYTGKLTIVTTTAHGLNNGATISISDNSLIFACDRDNYTTEHAYPRISDPASTSNAKLNNGVLAISNKSGSSFDVTITTPVLGGKVVGLSSFRLTSQNGGVPLFTKVFNPSDSTIMALNSDIFRINNHGFATGEKIQYDPGNYNYGNNRVSIAATNTYEASVGGATTNFLPSTLYVIKLDNNRFKVTGFSTSTSDNTFVPTAVGTGTEHSFDAGNPENRVMVDIDGVIQSPLYNKSVSVVLANAVGLTSTTLKLKGAGGQAGITSIKSNDIINIGNELMRVNQVGIGSTNVVSVDRALFGTNKESHLVSAACTMKAGHFNIVKDVIYFKTPPYGPTGEVGLTTQSSFHGRVFNRRDVANNFIFDDISHKFTGNAGTGRTFTLTEDSSDVTGIVTTVSGSGGSDEVVNYGVVLINGVFQRPKVDYEMTPKSISPNVGIGGSVSFTGETIESIPRGGKVGEVVPHSVLNGGFGGGYQPRIPAAATAVINAAGSVQSVTVTGNGSGYQSGPVTVEIQNPLGVGSAAVLQATVGTDANQGKITGITTISGGTGYSSADPAYNTHVAVVSTSGTTLTINVGTALPKGRYQHSFVRDSGTHTFVSGVTNAITASNGASGNFTAASGTTYNPLTGDLVLTIGSHSLTTSNKVTLADGAVTFTCDADSHATNHSYPRSSDPASGEALTISAKTGTTITVNVGAVKGANSVVTDTTAVAGSGSTAAFTPSTAVYDPNSGDLVLTKASGTWTHATNAGTLTPISGTAYNPSTGILTVKATGHGLVNNDLINILGKGLPFTCAKDSNATKHYYPRKTDPIFGKWIKITKVDNDTFTVWVGGSTYTGAHTFVTGESANKIRKATSYARLNDNSFVFTCSKDGNTTQHSYPRTGTTVPPIIKVGIATGYTNLSFEGGTGSGFVVDAVVGAAGSIISYDVRNRGFGYKNGEVLTVAGIPTDVTAGAGYSSFEFKVKEVFDDEFSGYSFGQLVPLDDFSKEFNGVKKVFTLTKTDIVKEIVTILSLDTSVNATNNLLIFLNDVLQKPGENYSLTGGTTVNFVEAPRGGSKLQVLFYRGGNADIEALNPVKTIKVGDKIQILQGENLQSQTDRVVSEITDVSKVETPPYGGGGITTDTSLVRVSAWKKQESDLIVDGLPIAKDRPTLIGKFTPSANIIQSVGITSGILYVDNAFPLFSAYDNRTDTDDIPGEVEVLNVQDIKAAHGYSTISSGGKLTSITLNNGSVGYAMSDFLYVSDRKLGDGGAPDLVIKVDTISQGGSIVTFSEQSGFANNAKRVSGYYENVSTTVGVSTATGKGIGAMFDISVDGNGKPTVIDIAGGKGYENAPTISISSKVPQTPEIGHGWTKVQSNTDINYRAVDYTPQGVFVAVGSTSGIQTSTDGRIWTTSSKGSTETKYYHGVVGLSTSIVIVGAGGTIITSNNAGSSFGPTKLFNKILTGFQYDYSEYKITQTLNDAAVGKRIVPSISSTIPQEKVVVVGAGGTIIISEPGSSGVTTTFVVNSFHATQDFNGVDHNQIDDDSGTFVAVGNAGAIYRSTNGEQWTGRTTPAITTNLRSVAYGNNTWIAVGVGGTVIKSTDDGLSWTVVNGGNIGVGNTISLHSVHYQKNVWVAVGTNGMALNSITGDTWYKKHIVNAGTPVGQIMYGLSYGDNKLVSVGMSSSIVWTGSEVRKATATSTIGAAGTVTGVTITDGGFGYDTSNPPNILFSQETVTREKLKSVNIKGDFGSIVGVGTGSNGIGAGTTSQRVIFELDSDPFLNQAAFGNIARSQLTVGDYFIVTGSRVGGAVTSVTKDGNVIGIGTTFADNVYRVEQSITSTSGITTVHCNIESNIGIGSHSSALKLEFGYYSWGKLYDLTRGTTPKSYSINNDNGYVGLTTGPTVTRINPLAVTYSNFDQTS